MSGGQTTPERVAVRPTLRWVFARPERALSFGFGSGLLRPGPGTWGTLAGWALWVLLLQGRPDSLVAVVLAGAFALGCWATQRTCADLGVHDHGGVNWDEIVAIWLVLWFLPPTVLFQVIGVVLFRLFDIFKPPPIRFFDCRFKSGFGIMVDDLGAAAYTLLTAAILIRLGVQP